MGTAARGLLSISAQKQRELATLLSRATMLLAPMGGPLLGNHRQSLTLVLLHMALIND